MSSETTIKKDTVVQVVLITGEVGIGFYQYTDECSGLHLIKNVRTESGKSIPHAYATEIIEN